VKIDLAWLRKQLPAASDVGVRAAMAARFQAALHLLDETLTTVKNLSAALRPRLLETSLNLSRFVEVEVVKTFDKVPLAGMARNGGV
jgi:hypothetical protein